ncbi:MAG: extracellular solute-binding protein, partial [Lachnospiraceae bacterium]|nr:extracellular solute-binding protein [Lachnospiraceae bacterium]
MKKKLLSVVLSAAMVSGILAGCGEAAPAANDAAAPAAEASEAAPAEETATAEAGSGKVYLLNFKPETDEAWQELAATYTEQTGVPVTVLTAADGQYSTTLQSEMAKSEAPTIFNIGNATAAQTWDEYTYDLKDSALYNHLTDKSLTVEYNGKVAAVANCYECYGIIYNKTILGDYCTMDNAVVSSIDEINSLDTLVAVAEDINNRVDEINEQFGYELTEAFASAGLDDGSSWRFSGH